jgi:hypothetical protein
MLALKHGPKHWIVHLCQRYEFFLGQFADINLCVSETFAKNLGVHMIKYVMVNTKTKIRFSFRASVLYDKPTNQFHIPTIEEKHQILMQMNTKYSYKQFQGGYLNDEDF